MHAFCRILLAIARRDSPDAPRGLHAWASPFGTYEVRDDQGKWIWEGVACCKWEARANAIMTLQDRE